jgi:hypothetical protein
MLAPKGRVGRLQRRALSHLRSLCSWPLARSLEVISQISQQDNDAPETHEAEIVLDSSLVADHQPPEVP